MNIEAAIRRPRPLKLKASDFWLLRESGAFAGFSKSELLEGELWGVPVQDEDEPESDAVFPIKLRVSDYERLCEAGSFQSQRRTELIDGLVYAMNPQYRPHGFAKDELAYRLRIALESNSSNLHVATEQSVAMPPHDEPEPDIILTTAPRGPGAIPGESVALLVEVSASTTDFDLNDKAHAYAAFGIPEYWVVDLNRAVIHQMWRPQGNYAERQEVPFGAAIQAATIAGLTIDTAGLS
ncbi:MAG TPA: Uma2 family endonuclease [Allosphingosinicella sp.]|jgi:Uma2 family endonuclease|nr:Uma2 family endonuclease [Allosphingosinicella sp.]